METDNIDLHDIQERLIHMEWQIDDNGDCVRRLFVGTVFSLYPSGKYYTPFANSNVTDEEVELDQDWREAIEGQCEELGLVFEHGEDDPCDCFIIQYRNEDVHV